MTTLSEIEAAADALSVEQKRELLLFVAERLCAQRAPLPAPRRFSKEQIDRWIDEDDAGGKQFGEAG
jgi:hypothetical protein